MGDEGDLALAGLDGPYRLVDVRDERRTTDRVAARVGRPKAEVVTDQHRRHEVVAAGEEGVDVAEVQVGVGKRVGGRLGVELDRSLVRDDADLVGLCCAHHGDAGAHGVRSERYRSM
jgi:hypothetical protein